MTEGTISDGRVRRLSRAAAGGAVFTIAGALQRGLPILLLPVYATALDPAEYGQISILVAVATVLGSIMSLGLEASVVRESVRLREDPPARHRFLNTIGWFTLMAPPIAAVVAWLLSILLGGFGLRSDVVLVAMLSVAAQTTMTVFVGAALRAEERLRDYLVVTVVQAVTTAALTLGFLYILASGPLGWFGGALLGGAAAVAVGLVLLGHRWTREVSWPALRLALAFGLPLLPHALAHWVLSLSDRLILGAFVDDAAVGVYNLAYQAAAPILLVMIAVHQGVMPLYPRAGSDAEVRGRLSRTLTGHVHLAAWLGMAAALLAPAVIVGLFPAAYAGAVEYLPWLALGYVLFGLYFLPMDSMSLMLGRTRWLWIPTVLAAITNVLINLVFVPRFGALAAAIATAAAYGVLLLGVVIARLRMPGPRVDYQIGRMGTGVAWVALLTGAAFLLFPDHGQVGATLGRAVVVAIAAVGLVAAHLRDGASHRSDRLDDNTSAARHVGPEDGLALTVNRA